MASSSRFRIQKQVSTHASVEVSERCGIRYLHLGSDIIQSAMRLARPNELELSYTRCMMAFLLFVPAPEDVVLIGLGGGSLAKFIHFRLPNTRVTAVEINPQVVAAARRLFQLPDDSDRLRVKVDDGAAYVQSLSGSADAILVDGYGGDCGAPELGTVAFYEDCERALSDNGVLVLNLFSGRPRVEAQLCLLDRIFSGRLLCLRDERRGNLIVMAFVRSQGRPRWRLLGERAERLAQHYGLEFPAFVGRLRDVNPHDASCLFI